MLTILLLTESAQVASECNGLLASYFERFALEMVDSISGFLHEFEKQSHAIIMCDCTSIQKRPGELHQIMKQTSNKRFCEVVYIVDQTFEVDDLRNLPQANFLTYPFRATEFISIFRLLQFGNDHLLDADVQRQDQLRYQSLASFSNSFVLNEVIHNAVTGEVSCRQITANSNFEKNTGLVLSELKNRLLSELFPRNDQRRVIERSNVVEQRTVQFDEYSPKTKRHYRVFGFSPQMNQVAAMLLDISEIKKNEIALQEAQALSKQADALKTAFIANLSHEIRTPMNSIIGFSGLLDSDDITLEKKQLFVSQIHKSCNALLNLIEDMLDLSRLQSNQLELQSKPFQLTSLLHELQQFTQKRLSDTEKLSSIDVVYQAYSLTEHILLKSDKIRLAQVLRILLDNAIKYTERGKVTVSWQLLPGNAIPGMSVIEFSITDTGIGMRDEQLSLIFDAFTKLDTDNAARYGGIGVGLTLAKKITALMQGSLWVESKFGEGSTFRLSLPIAQLNHDKNQEYPQEVACLVSDGWAHRTILLVDDEEMNLFFLEELLSPMNASLLYADNGIEAIEMCKKNPEIDLVIMDLRMPFMDGFTATTKIKAQFPHLPVIMQTTLSLSDDVASITACGADEFVAKPIDVQLFMKILQRFLDGKPEA